jgi:hypothetical protein
MNNMSFLPVLSTFLETHNEIYTVRSWKYSSGRCVIENVGICNRYFVKRVSNFAELEPFVVLSGFPSLDDWKDQIRKFIKSGNMFLYRVSMKK